MKNHFKYSILITLTLLMLVSSVKAVNIGTTTQPNPFESQPQGIAYYNVWGPTDKTKMNNGDLADSGGFQLGANTILNPNGDGNYAEWTQSWLFWADWPAHDGTTTERTVATLSKRATSTLTDVPSDASGAISSVRVYAVAKKTLSTATIALNMMLRLGGLDTFSANIVLSTAYTLYSADVLRPGGGAWSWADINSLEAGVRTSTAGTLTTVSVTQLYVEIRNSGTAGYFELNAFTTSPDPTFTTIGFIDFKLKYSVPSATAGDTYRIQISTDGGTTWGTLQADTTSMFDEGGSGAVMPWAQVTEPTDGTWDWTDVSNLKFRITATQVGGTWDVKTMNVFEVWATVYSTGIPPSASTAVSVQPPAVLGGIGVGQNFFVDVYVQAVSNLAGFEFTMSFDTSIVSFVEAWSYWPWTDVIVTPDESSGLVSVLGTAIPPTVDTGFTGNSPMARVYFSVDQGGSTALDLPVSKIGAPGGIQIAHAKYGGFFSSPIIMSAIGSGPVQINLASPISTQWHEYWPTYSPLFHLTSWNDNGDGVLSASDQIDMTDETNRIHFYHVDQVTVTIHWTFKAPDVGIGAAEPVGTTEMPPGDPIGTSWHQIYPTYSRTFTITSWIDNDGSGTFNPSDQFDWEYDDNPGTLVAAHLDAVSTDIWVSEKPMVPEFPVFAIMPIALLVAVGYLWLKRRAPTKLSIQKGGVVVP